MRAVSLWLLLFCSMQAWAWQWRELWQTPDQEAQALMTQHQYLKAEARFEHPAWKAVAAYRGQHYERAAHAFETQKTADGFYNQGNALAYLQQYEAAIGAYDRALKLNPKHEDAFYNREIIKKLLQKKQQQNSSNQENHQNQSQEKKDQQEKSEQNPSSHGQKQQQSTTHNQEKQTKHPTDPKTQPQREKTENPQKNTRDSQAEKSPQGQEKQTQSKAEKEKQQANEQWLRLIPEDPGGLLREKFLRDHLRRGES